MTERRIATVDVHELKKQLDDHPSLCLIDVRELDEWQTVRIPGAVHIPKGDITARVQEVTKDLDRPVYLHCKGGMRSLYAASCLLDMGYKQVYSVDGGISDWVASGYPVES